MATIDRAKEIREVLNDIVNTLVREYKPERILLYGSRASGEPDEASDIDLFIVKESQESPYRRAVRVRRLLRNPARRIPVELLVVTPQELKQRLEIGDQFVQEILSRGEVLYAG
jgi:predicted nucleotidyltransferase